MKAGSRLSIPVGMQNTYNKVLAEDLLPSDVFTYTNQADYDIYRKHLASFQRRIGKDEYIRDDKFITKETFDVTNLKKFETSQRSIDSKYILKILKNGYKSNTSNQIHIFRDGNKLWVEDGHHRLVAAMLSGKKTLSLNVTDITPRK